MSEATTPSGTSTQEPVAPETAIQPLTRAAAKNGDAEAHPSTAATPAEPTAGAATVVTGAVTPAEAGKPTEKPTGKAATKAATKAAAKAATGPEATNGKSGTSFLESLREWTGWLWSVGGVFAAVLLWWPAAYSGTADFLTFPARAADIGVTLAGALAASGATALLVRSPWPRFVIAFAFPVICLARSGGPGGYPLVELVTLFVLVLAGIALGAYGTGSVLKFAVVLAFLMGVTPGGIWDGPFLALALALPFAKATLHRVAPTIFGVIGVAVSWLLGVLVLRGVVGGFAKAVAAHAEGAGFVTDGLKESFTVAKAGASTVLTDVLQAHTGWFVVAAVLAAVIVVARAVTTGARRR